MIILARMKKLLLVFCLSSVAGVTQAQWRVVAETDFFTTSIDPSTIRKEGRFVRYWELTNYVEPRKSARGGLYLSTKLQVKLDCKEERSAIISSVGFSGKDGYGEIVYSESVAAIQLTWSPDVPGSAGAKVSDFVCHTKDKK